MVNSELVKSIMSLTVEEAAKVVKELQDTLGISPASFSSQQSSGSAAVVSEEKTSFNVILKSVDGNKMNVFKVVREFMGGDSFKLPDFSKMTSQLPFKMKSDISEDDANDIKAKLAEVGAVVDIE